MSKQIDEVYAWVSIDPDDDCEGVIGVLMAGTWTPLIAADSERLNDIRPIAEAAQRDIIQAPIRLIRLSVREVVEDLPYDPPREAAE